MSQTAVKLNQANLQQLSPAVAMPAYQRQNVSDAIVHIGVGGFHRAHQAVYIDDLLSRYGRQHGVTDWGICGVGLLPHDTRIRDAMNSQNGLYTVVERSAAGNQARIIGVHSGVLFAPDDPEAVLQKMAAESTRIVSLTITEGGYFADQKTGDFLADHPDIVYDLQHPQQPKTAFGYILEALERRRQRGQPPFTVMSCDNVQGNGEVTRRVVLGMAARRDDQALHDWLAANAAFPNGMVDRITPATTAADRAMVREQFGIDDAWPVVCEPFRQWVLEDKFCCGRPALEKVGVQMTNDVHPYEKMKIRLLNASHQAMCYIGMLSGLQYAHETMEDAQIRKLVQMMMDVEVTPLLSPVPGVDLDVYKKTLIERFANPTIKDQLSRIGTEGSARIPKFVLPSIREQLARNGPIDILSFTVACWLRYLTGEDDQGRSMPIIDPIQDKLQEHARRGGRDPRPMLSLTELFGDDLPKSQVFIDKVSSTLASFYDNGARATLAKAVGA
jgi:mannitol 2-dehydrogenase